MKIQNFAWNGQAVSVYEAILYIAIVYIVLCMPIMVTITKHVLINIFQMEHFSAVKFTMVTRKVWNKIEQNGLGCFNMQLELK